MKISKSEARYGRGTQSEHCGKAYDVRKVFLDFFSAGADFVAGHLDSNLVR
jgi:hypothetical protein